MSKTIPPLKQIKINNQLPLIICDADEVIFQFMNDFELYLKNLSMYFSWKSYALSKNIMQKDGSPIEDKNIKPLIFNFFENYTLKMKPVKDAKTTLDRLSLYYNIIILSNIPHEFYHQRIQALKTININYFFISNIGDKGKVVNKLTINNKNKCWFIDDSPLQIISVNKEAPKVKTIHLVTNKKLLNLMKKNSYSFNTTENWKKLEQIIIN